MRRTRTAAAVGLVMVTTVLAGCSSGATPAASDASPSSAPAGSGTARADGSGSPAPTSGTATETPAATPAPAPAQLPRGGRVLFPRYRLVGYSGGPGAEAFGRLGVGDLDARAREIEQRWERAYTTDGRQFMPVVELIATVALADPGPGGKYRARQETETIAEWLAAARRVKGVLLLNIQPGRARFIDEAKAFSRWLEEPDVGLALDPEWAVDAGERPGEVYGDVSGRELDEISDYVAGIVRRNDLPQKAMVVHRVSPGVIEFISGLRARPEVAVIQSVDGIGSRAAKEDTNRVLTRRLPGFVHPGFKLFFIEDLEGGPLMTPPQVMALRPRPEYVLYE